jgi:hypothetical protein
MHSSKTMDAVQIRWCSLVLECCSHDTGHMLDAYYHEHSKMQKMACSTA